jgi:hypothetical protein
MDGLRAGSSCEFNARLEEYLIWRLASKQLSKRVFDRYIAVSIPALFCRKNEAGQIT